MRCIHTALPESARFADLTLVGDNAPGQQERIGICRCA
jgi:hypothetical protein